MCQRVKQGKFSYHNIQNEDTNQAYVHGHNAFLSKSHASERIVKYQYSQFQPIGACESWQIKTREEKRTEIYP